MVDGYTVSTFSAEVYTGYNTLGEVRLELIRFNTLSWVTLSTSLLPNRTRFIKYRSGGSMNGELIVDSVTKISITSSMFFTISA